MFYLSDVLEFIVYGLDYRALAHQHLVRYTHEAVLHPVFQFGNQLYSIDKQLAEQFLADIPPVADEFAEDILSKLLHVQRFPVVHIAGSEHEVDYLAHFVAHHVQLESEEPAHGAFAALGNPLEDSVLQYPLVPAHTQRRAVNDTYSRAFAHQNQFDKCNQL